MQVKRIVVGVKPDQRGMPIAASHARELAHAAGAELRIVGTVFDASVESAVDPGEPAGAAREHAPQASGANLESLARALRDWGVEVTTQVNAAVPPHEGIAAAAREWQADLIVVGTHEHGPFGTRLTETHRQLARGAECPVLIVQSEASFHGYSTIVAAVDPLHAHDEPFGLDHAVLAAGRSIAAACGSTLRAVYAYPGREAFELASAVEVAPGVFYGAENVEDVHRRAVDELAAQFRIAPAEVDLVVGKPAEAIVAAVERHEAELVVVGAARRRSALAAALGSTAEQVAGAVPCDVLIVPPAK